MSASSESAKLDNKSDANASSSEIVYAPMDGDGVQITFHKAIGEEVVADELIAEVESDKATVEINAPVTGVISQIFVKAGEELDVTPDTKICEIKGSASSTTP